MQEEFYEKWQDLSAWISDELMPVGARPKAATFLVKQSFTSEDFNRRKVAATLAGYIEKPEHLLLLGLFNSERARDAAMQPDSPDRIYCQSVMEDIVFSAIRWCRNPALKQQGLSILSSLVEKTIAGEYWNTSSYAMATLCFYSTPNSQQLLKEFQAYSEPSVFPFFGKVKVPKHPSNPSLGQEKEFAKGLTANNPQTIKAIENLLDEKTKLHL